jgi:hypothetical protein
MQGITMLITSDGEWVFPDTPEFFEAFGDPNPDYDSVSFAVRNLGFVKFHLLGQSIAEIEVHPRNVALAALLAVQQHLLTSTVNLFRLRFFDGEWRSEISSSRDHVIARLSEICAPALTPAPTERFNVEPQAIDRAYADGNWTRPMIQKWRVSFGQFDPTVIGLALKHNLLDRLVIIGVRRPAQEPVWRFIGDGHKWIGNQFRFGGIGEPLENMPDKEYGAWATSYYKAVASSGQPRYDLVTGSIQWEDEAGQPRRWYRYERLMLPWKTPSDEVFVTLCSRPFGTVEEVKSEGSNISPLSIKSAMSA